MEERETCVKFGVREREEERGCFPYERWEITVCEDCATQGFNRLCLHTNAGTVSGFRAGVSQSEGKLPSDLLEIHLFRWRLRAAVKNCVRHMSSLEGSLESVERCVRDRKSKKSAAIFENQRTSS